MRSSVDVHIVVVACLLLVTWGECQRKHSQQNQRPMQSSKRRMSDQVDELRPLNIIEDQITLSGFSSGGSIAQILQVAHSSVFQGVGVFSHTFLRCGPPNGVGKDFDRVCTKILNAPESEYYNPELVHSDLADYESKGLIDELKNLRNKRLYVYTGLKSTLFTPVQALNVLEVYERYIQNPYKIKTRVQNAGFVMPTDNDFGKNCTNPTRDTFFIANCGFSGAYEMLRFIYADNFKVNYPKKNVNFQRLRTFNQVPFQEGLTNHQMDDIGFYYIPESCDRRGKPCRLHVFFHGCFTGRNFTGSGFVRNSGFLEVAEENGIIMLFPQNYPRPELGGSAIGCWDTFGVSGPLYATQQGDQIISLKRMIDAVIGAGNSNGPNLSNPHDPIKNFNRPAK